MLLAGEGNINGDRKLMVMRLSIIALGAFCCLFSGCGCSKEKIRNLIAAMPKEEIEEMIEQNHGAEADCRFCSNLFSTNYTRLISLIFAALP